MAIIHNTDLFHENSDLSSQQRILSLKQRISKLKKEQTTLYIGQPLAEKSDDECYQEIADACKQFIQDPIEEKERNLALTLESHNLQLYCYPANNIIQDKKDVARIAFDGYIKEPREGDLSKTFRNIKNNPEQQIQINPDDYDLSFSTTWNVFKQVPEFAAIEDKVKKGLSTYGISSGDLPALNLKDFCYIICEQMRPKDKKKFVNDRESRNDKKSVKVFKESYKARHTKRFIEENEEEFRKGLLSMPGVKKEYVKTLIRAMKNGITDLTKYEENGTRVWKEEWANQPVITAHHIVNVKDYATKEAEGKSFIHINDYENMCFIVRYPEHDAMHAFEQDLQGNCHEDIFSNTKIGHDMFYRIQPPPGVRCMLGFHNMIYDRKYLGLPEKEKKNIEEKAANDPNRISGKYYKNNKNDPYLQRREWRNRGRFNA